jgi:hypothetical protein
MTCKPYLSDPGDMKIESGYDFNQTGFPGTVCPSLVSYHVLVPIMLDKVAPVFMFLDLVSCHVLVPIMLDKVDPVFIFLELVSCHVLVPIMLDKVDPVFMFLDLVWKSTCSKMA